MTVAHLVRVAASSEPLAKKEKKPGFSTGIGGRGVGWYWTLMLLSPVLPHRKKKWQRFLGGRTSRHVARALPDTHEDATDEAKQWYEGDIGVFDSLITTVE